MCGIVGVVGKENTTDILINGLEKLEYRGYDSAGLFVLNNDHSYSLLKAEGRIANLVKKINHSVKGTVGIGHTRWATHGKANEENAHPHTSESGQYVLVHNGVIENSEQIKQKCLTNHHFTSETDTEVVVHLIEKLAQEQHLSTKEAFKAALEQIKGSYAFVLINNQEPDTLYIAKNKSPLLIGVGDSFNVVCSDALAMIKETNQFLELQDEEIAVVKANSVVIENKLGKKMMRQSFMAEIDGDDIEKGAYPFYMLKEIDEQPAVIRNIIDFYRNKQQGFSIDKAITQAVLQSERIYIIACGTSWHAGWIGKQLLEKCTGIPVEVHLSSEFAYNMPILNHKPFFIFLSQSGETADSRQVLVQVNQLNACSLTITNVKGSTLSREATFTLPLCAGPEIAVASTKAYIAQIAVLAILASVAGTLIQKKMAHSFDLQHELSIVANAMETIIAKKETIKKLVNTFLTHARNAFYIGRGVDYYVSMEAALKLKEISYIQAEGFAAGELKHGTIALIEKGTPVIGIITNEHTANHTRGNLKEVESRGAQTLIIAMEGLEQKHDHIVLPYVHPLLTPLVSVIPTQLLAYYAALQKGYDVDKPRNLAKSVTVE